MLDRCNSPLDLAILGPSLFIARPVDKQTIEYLIHVGKILASDSGSVPDSSEDVLDRGEILDLICTRLGMTEAELISCTGKTLLSTARQVIGGKYPDESTEFAQVDNEHILAAAGECFRPIYAPSHVYFLSDYAWFSHPLEKRSNDLSKIRKAMGNVFATRKFSRKLKNGCPSTTAAVPDDDSNEST